jgi:hypothetical protein
MRISIYADLLTTSRSKGRVRLTLISMVVLSHHHPQLAVHAVPRHPGWPNPKSNMSQKFTKHHYDVITKPAKLLQALRVDSWFRLQGDEPGPWSEALLWTG